MEHYAYDDQDQLTKISDAEGGAVAA
ncbi:hypothetical protein MID08_14725 [Pseudomonas entomophila]|nr:hypothetical protein [Pseudomonas entomophila]